MKPISHLCTAALLIALVSASPHALAAPAADATQPAAARPRIGLVLSGGGARGLSHVGVLKVLERERIPVDVIAGTSMGAIVGGLYASGMSAQQVEQEVLRLDWGGVFTSRVERRELTQRRKEQDTEVAPLLELGLGADGLRAPLAPVSSWQLEAHLRRLTLPARQVADFDRLPTPFRAVATDMETGQPVILQSGDLATALRSSMSVPGVFAPVEVDGRLLGDGGLVNNTPVDVARAMGAQRLIVVNIGTPLARREALSTLTGVTGQMINILTEQNVQRSLASLSPQDVLIAPVLDGLSAADFERAVELMNQGEIQAEALVLRMQDLKLSEADYARWLAKRQARQAAPQPLREVRFAGSKHTHPEHLSAALETRAGDVFDVAKAERDLRRLAATGDYVRTDFQLQGPAPGEPPGDTLTFRVEDKPWGPNYLQLGLDFAVDTHGRSAFNLKLAHNRHWLDDSGAEWRNFVRLGTSPALGTEWWRPVPVLAGTLPGGLRPFVSAHAGLERRSTELWAQPQGEVALSVVRQQRQWGADVGLAWRELGEFRLGWLQENGHDEPELTSPEWQGLRTEQRWRERGLRWRAAFDQLDSAYFPTQGWRLDAQYVHGKRQVDGGGGAAWQTMAHWDANLLAVRSWGAHTVQGQVRLAGGSGALPDLPRYGLGGFGQMSAYAADQLSGQQVALLRLGYAYKLGQAPLTRGLYVGANIELGQAAQRWGELGQGGWEPGASLYLGADTAMGPVHAGLGLAQGLRPTLMLVVGRP